MARVRRYIDWRDQLRSYLNDDRKVAEHMTMACNVPNKSRERRKD